MHKAFWGRFIKPHAWILLSACLSAGMGSIALAQTVGQSAVEPTAYSRLSDQQLNELLANRLDQLDGAQRRALFTEVKLRMNRHKGGAQAIRFRTERRYGRRIIRQSDGTLVRIQTRVVRVRPVPDGRQSYGVGFEERNKDTQSSRPDAPPVQTVNDRPR